MNPPQIVFGPPPKELPGKPGSPWVTWALALEEIGFVALYQPAFSYERKLGDGVVLRAVLVPQPPPDAEGFAHCRIAVLSRYADGDDRELCALRVLTPYGLKGVLELPARKAKRK